jgi:hypothetical protein
MIVVERAASDNPWPMKVDNARHFFDVHVVKRDIIIIIIIILGISFMQGIYTYIPETNHAPREHCVETILM